MRRIEAALESETNSLSDETGAFRQHGLPEPLAVTIEYSECEFYTATVQAAIAGCDCTDPPHSVAAVRVAADPGFQPLARARSFDVRLDREDAVRLAHQLLNACGRARASDPFHGEL